MYSMCVCMYASFKGLGIFAASQRLGITYLLPSPEDGIE